MTGAILKYDAACAAIAEAKTVDEVTDWVDRAAAVKEYGRRIKNRQIEIDAIEIRVKAQRRRGEILAEMAERGQIRRGQPKKVLSADDDVTFTLKDLGVSRDESSEDQRLAAIPRDSFERLVARCREYAEAHPEKHSFDVLGENAAADKKRVRENRERVLGACQLALPDKKFGVILADPEWRFKTYSRETGMDRAADNHYPTSETDAICARPVGDIAAADCVLFLWATAPMLPDALRVVAAWGFEYKSHAVWKKDRIGTGYWLRNQHELLLIGTRGKIPAPAMGTQFASVIDAPLGKHSEKPDAFYELIEAYFPTLPKIELNARRSRVGWESWGNEAPLPAHDPITGEVIDEAIGDPSFAAGVPSDAGETVAAAADAIDGASPVAAVTDIPAFLPPAAPAFPPTEFADLQAFLARAPAEQLAPIAPAYVVRGLVQEWLGEWRITRAGQVRLDVLTRERTERDRLFAKHLAADQLIEWRALAAIAAGELVDRETARDLIGKGYVDDFAADRGVLGLTASGQKWLGSIEAHVEKTEGIERPEPLPLTPVAPKQLDLMAVIEGAK